MRVDIHKCKNDPTPFDRRFLFVPEGFDLDLLPEDVRNDLGELLFQKTIDLKRGQKRIGLKTDEAVSNIESRGYHIQVNRVDYQIVFPGAHIYPPPL